MIIKGLQLYIKKDTAIAYYNDYRRFFLNSSIIDVYGKVREEDNYIAIENFTAIVTLGQERNIDFSEDLIIDNNAVVEDISIGELQLNCTMSWCIYYNLIELCRHYDVFPKNVNELPHLLVETGIWVAGKVSKMIPEKCSIMILDRD